MTTIYLNYDKIKGDATDDSHKDWIEVSDVEFSVERTFSTGIGSSKNRESTQPKLGEITITKRIDTASPLLFQEAVSGTKGKDVKIEFVSTAQGGAPYCSFLLKNTLVGSYSLESESDRPIEKVNLNFTWIKYSVAGGDLAGLFGKGTDFTYDFAAGKSG